MLSPYYMAAIDTQVVQSEDPCNSIGHAKDLTGVLDETKRFYKELNSKLGNIKDYLVQEVETGMFSFEMYLLKQMESKQEELAQLMRQIEAREHAAEEDQLGKTLESEIKWFRVREVLLNSNAAKFGNALIETKRRVLDLRKTQSQQRMELWRLQEENNRMSLQLRNTKKSVNQREEPLKVVPEELIGLLPPLSLLMELSPKSLGSLKIREIQQYQLFKARLRSAKQRLSQCHEQSHTLPTSPQACLSPHQDLRQVFQSCFESHAKYTVEMTMPKLACAKSPASTRSSSCELLTEGEVRRRDVARVAADLAARPSVLEELIGAVFGVRMRPKHIRILSLG